MEVWAAANATAVQCPAEWLGMFVISKSLYGQDLAAGHSLRSWTLWLRDVRRECGRRGEPWLKEHRTALGF